MKTIFRVPNASNTKTAAKRDGRFVGLSPLETRLRRRGAALVEFGMIATIFLVMLLGMIQFGIYQSTSNTLWNLSREGARFASVGNPTDDQIKSRIRQIAPPNISPDKLSIVITYDTDTRARASGQPVTVSLTYDMGSKIIFPLVTTFLKNPRTVTTENGGTKVVSYPYSTVSTMRVE